MTQYTKILFTDYWVLKDVRNIIQGDTFASLKFRGSFDFQDAGKFWHRGVILFIGEFYLSLLM